MQKMMNSGRTLYVKRNIFYGFLQVAVSYVLPFIVRTILIYRFGVEYLGLNGLFASVLSVLSLMELGFGSAIAYSMYKPAAEGDTEQICAYLKFYRRVYLVVGFAILLVGLFLMLFLAGLVKDPSLPGGLNLYLCYLIYLGDSVISYLLYGYMSVIPIAFQRRDILSRIDMGMSLLSCIVKSLVLLGSCNFYWYLLASPPITVMRNLVTAYVVKRQYPDLKCGGNLSAAQRHILNKRVYGLLIDKLTGVSRNSIDTLCISTMIGLAVTGIYNNYYFVMASLISFSAMICRSMIPSAGNSIALESREKNYADMRLFDYTYMMIMGWATTCLLCLYQPFMMMWVGEQMMLGTPVVVAIGIYFYVLKTGDIRWVYHEGAGLWWESRWIMAGETVANIVFNILLCRIWGVIGIVLATVISVSVTNCVFFPKLIFQVYFQNNRLREYWIDHLCYTGTMILSAGLCWLLCYRLFPMSLVTNKAAWYCFLCLGGRLVLCTGVSLGVFWIIWHKTERYEKAFSWIRKTIAFDFI